MQYSEVGRSSPSLETIENIARVLEVELRDLFDFSHLDPEATTPEELFNVLQGQNEPNRQLLSRIARLLER